jgi:hypothetical protein
VVLVLVGSGMLGMVESSDPAQPTEKQCCCVVLYKAASTYTHDKDKLKIAMMCSGGHVCNRTLFKPYPADEELALVGVSHPQVIPQAGDEALHTEVRGGRNNVLQHAHKHTA